MKKKSSISTILGGDIFKSRTVLKQMPLLILILVLSLVIVSMRYRVESLYREKKELERSISLLHEKRLRMQKQYQQSIRISTVDQKLDTIGVGLVPGPPYEIKVF